MTARKKTKKALNEFFDPASLALMGGLAAGAYGMYRGVKKGTGARWRAWQRIKHTAGTAIPDFASKVASGEHLKQTEEWHKRIAEKYGPTYTYDKYKQHLAQHAAITAMAPDRDSLIQTYETALKTRKDLLPRLQPVQDRHRQVIRAGLDPAKEPYDPANPSLGTVEHHLFINDPKNLDVHGNPLTNGVDSLHHVLSLPNQPYVDPFGVKHLKAGSSHFHTYGDVIGMTDIERMDSQNPEAAAFRRKVTTSIIEPRQKLISTLDANVANNAQSYQQHDALMKADKDKQAQDLEMSRSALKPWLFVPGPKSGGIGMGERMKRLAVKTARHVTDRLRTIQ